MKWPEAVRQQDLFDYARLNMIHFLSTTNELWTVWLYEIKYDSFSFKDKKLSFIKKHSTVIKKLALNIMLKSNL